MLTKQCAHCGTTIFKKSNTPMREWTEQTKFCSRACYWAHKRILPPTSELIVLYESGQSAETIARQFGVTGTSVYEQLIAAGVIFRKSADYDLPQRQKRSFGACERCGKSFAHAFKRGGTGKPKRFCGLVCKIAWYRAANVYNYLGEDAKNFPTDMEHLTFWMQRAAEVRARDKVCRDCGKTPSQNRRALDVHHIVPYRLSHDNSMENLIALCRSCHTKAEHKVQTHSRLSKRVIPR